MADCSQYRDSITNFNPDEQCMWVLRNATRQLDRLWAARLLASHLQNGSLTRKQSAVLRDLVSNVRGSMKSGEVHFLKPVREDFEVIE